MESNRKLLEEIKSKVDIVDVISEHVDVRKAGKSFKALCPFHSEKTPSFVISAEKQVFHCFGCGVGGDIVAFVMKKEGVEFIDALKMLAERAGVAMPESGGFGAGAEGRGAAQKVLLSAMQYYSATLKKSDRAQNYLKERAISDEIIAKFNIGYAPEGRDHLYRHLKKAGFNDADIKKSGVISYSDGGAFDFFRGRAMFPIMDARGAPIAFGGRVTSEAQPKYINSPETALFKKRAALFGLDIARAAISKTGYAVVVEGYFDVLTCHAYGFENVVAPLGTALTEEHAVILKRFAQNFLFVFDGDKAGVSAARRSMHMATRMEFSAKALLLPGGADPDGFLRDRGAEEMKRLMQSSGGFIDFMLTTGGRDLENLREIKETVILVGDSILKGRLISELAQKASIPEAVLWEDVKRHKPDPRLANNPRAANTKPKFDNDEKFLLRIYLAHPDMARKIDRAISPDEVGAGLFKKVFQALHGADFSPSLDSLHGVCTPDEIDYISGLMLDDTGRMLNPQSDLETVEKNTADCIRNIRRNNLKKTLSALDEKIRQAATDQEKFDLHREKMRIKGELTRI
jgi:DNA primase